MAKKGGSGAKPVQAKPAARAQPNEFLAIERKWQELWEKEKIYSFDPDRKGDVFSIDTPPPTVSGRMHLGHAFSYAQADFIARYKRMRGFSVFYPFGLDDNGLATERLVENSRNIRAKDFTREQFIKICLEETKKHEDTMIADFRSLGLSVDWALIYRTIDGPARKASQRSFMEIYGKGRAYRKEAPAMWCPSCETAVAQAELEDIETDSIFSDIVFRLDNGKELVIATTRPELLPSCVAVFIHPDDKRKKELLGRKAKVPLFNHTVPILEDRRVDMQKGTGIVMCCTFGDQTDMEWYFAHSLPLRAGLTPDGRMTKLAGKYEGKKIKEARKEILEDLAAAKLLKGQRPIRHAVKVHERCKAEMEIMNTKQWFIKYLDLKQEFLRKGDELKWHPEHMKVRYRNWITGLQWDWSLSRQRFFGVPFPVWYCAKCGETILAGEKQLPVDPLQDKPPVKKCPKCGSAGFEPEKDVLDTWATSSLTPQINSKWGEDEKLHAKIFPMSLRPQAHDIITLWAFNTVVKAYFHAGKLPWKDIMISGHALDSKGRKMSKSLGNVVNPVEMVEKYSADMLRYWAATGTLGDDLPFQEKEFVTAKKFLTKLANASKFVAMKTEGVKPEEVSVEAWNMREIDRWILSRFSRAKKEATQALEAYEYSRALSALRNFFWNEFADFYIEEVKHRVYSEDDKSARAAKAVLVKLMSELLKALAPFIPHTAEEIFKTSFGACAKEKSIHLEKWPTAEEEYMDENAEKAGEIAKAVISGIRKHKTEKGLAMNADVGEVTIFLEKDEVLAEKVLADIKETMKAAGIAISAGKGRIDAGNGITIDVK
ncbi:MAG: valine--tRNA ligase [Candidatus Diapherotrites archaeon]|uniref:Valine--tRNA ligase n=1 Tax=Candidatus Iainarchaeum sp. TaxID=3101447 RepID=A0A8T3YM16_9ARCH|nr:valine--tRNA ligase [Candidatus Diapherotrites archaeon]